MATGTTAEQIIDVVTPAAGESVSEGTILEWHVKVGDFIRANDTIVEISTDKVDLELPAPASGTVTEILIDEGETVTVGQVIARLAVGDAPAGDGAAGVAQEPRAPAPDTGQPSAPDTAQPSAPDTGQQSAVSPPQTASHPETPPATGPAQDAGAQPQSVASQTTPGPPAAAEAPASERVLPAATPVAQRAAAVEGVDLTGVSGSGPAGRITKSDVLSAAGNGSADAGVATAGAPSDGKVAEPARGEMEPMKGAAAALARYMEQSRAIPTATSFRTLTVGTLDARRRELKEAGHRVSFTHLIAYAIARAATEMPVMADHFAEVDGQPYRARDGQVNLGLAVDVEKRDGSRTLMVPVIVDAGRMQFAAFVAAYDALVEKARTNTLTADDLQGANITLTNPGGLGTVASVPRLMSGQGTIVATGAIGYPAGLEVAGPSIGAEKVMTMTSTYDHRVIQGAESGRFLGLIDEH
ncbi:MAG: multifunctional oxoglutarate decarboxylase/oxoglutarate dehydrogenase thiamine pyrophosphate-binding subunit/dihydrolipoyllysine-residue succinyltransferase subunit, partial [Actinobacteria bacterium]